MTKEKKPASGDIDIGVAGAAANPREAGEVIRTLIVSAYPTLRVGLRTMLEGRPPIEVIGESAPAADLDASPDVIVSDASDEVLGPLRQAALAMESGLVLLGGGPETVSCMATSALPAWALLSRESSAEEIAAAIVAVSEGLVVLNPDALRALGPVLPMGIETGESPLSDRELQILRLMAEGSANKQIADRLGISLHTAKFHVASILAKMSVSSRTEAVTEGIRRGILHV